MPAEAARATTTAKELRHELDRAVSRASVDSEYTRLLLADPTLALEEHVYPPQLQRALRSIHAGDLADFSRQALALFWSIETRVLPPTSSGQVLTANERPPRAAVAVS